MLVLTAVALLMPTRRIRFENPTALTNFVQMLAILLDPNSAALCLW